MPAGATGYHNNPVGIHDLIRILLNAAHGNGSFHGIQSSAETIINGLGLFKDFFQHEMIISAFFNSGQFHVQFLHIGGQFLIPEIFQYQFIRFYNGQFIIVYIHHFFGVLEHG